MVRKSLPPGFRFHPTDIELVLYHLKRKIMGKKFHYEAIAEVNIYKHSPWDLPDKSCLKSKDLEWFFFCPREKKYASGVRVKRATEKGYWKTTGKDRNIYCDTKIVGTVKTLVFHLGHAPRGERTDWVIHEYKILDNKLASAGVQDNYVLCKVFKKNGLGPKNGAQYGAPFSEADWTDDDDDVQNCAISLTAEGSCPTPLMENEEQSLPPGSGLFGSENRPLPILNEGPSSSSVVPTSMVAAEETTDGVTRLLASCLGEDSSLSNWNGLSQEDLSGNGQNALIPSSEGMDLFSDLNDLDSWTDEMNQEIFDYSGVQNVDYSLNNMLPEDNSNYIELDDLLSPLEGSNGVSDTHLSSLCPASTSYSHENMQQLNSVNTIAGMGQFTFYANGGNSLDVLQMADYQFNPGSNASYNLELPFGQLEDADYSPDNMMERGSHLEMEWILPAQLPTAAAISLSSLFTCGGSSIHIKAEVTHRAGECTNEALSLMMEGSSSCWFHHSLVLQGLLLNFIRFASYFVTVIIGISSTCRCLNLVNWSSISIAPISVVSSLMLEDDHCSSHPYIDTFTNYSILRLRVMSDILSM